MEELAKTAVSLVAEVKKNFSELLEEWRSLQRELLSSSPSISPGGGNQLVPHLPAEAGGGVGMNSDSSLAKGTLLVQRSDLEKLSTEALMLKEFLPKVLNHDYVAMVRQLSHVKKELEATVREKDIAVNECEHLKRRTESLMADCEQEKREKFETKSLLSELNEQLTQQADYCSSLGAASCTLLWRVSQREDCIHSILSGSKVDEFLQLVSSTLQSYQATYSEGLPQETSEEAQFVLALCGIVTNIGASAFGRDYLSTNESGHALINMFCLVLAETPISPQWAKLKNLILMSLFNISPHSHVRKLGMGLRMRLEITALCINQKGLHYLSSKPELMTTLVWILQKEQDTDNRCHALKLLQSLLLEPVSTAVVQQALQTVPMQLLQMLSVDPNPRIQDIASELMSDLQSLATQMHQHCPHLLNNQQ